MNQLFFWTFFFFFLNFQLSHLDMDGTFVKSSGLPPVKKDRSNIFLENSALTLIIKKHKNHLSNMLTQLTMRNPRSNFSELFKVHSNVFNIKEEQTSLKLSTSSQNKKEVFE